MSARTWAQIGDDLLDDPGFEEMAARAGLHLIERGPYVFPGSRWCKLLDDGAPEVLEGRRVDYTIGSLNGDPVVTERRALNP